MEGVAIHVAGLRDRLLDGLRGAIDGVEVNGAEGERLPGNLSVRFAGVTEPLLQGWLAERGVACSSGSACTATIRKPSHVITAMGLPEEASYATLRFSLGRHNTGDQVDRLVEILAPLVRRARG
jgi:cysteine desulfurase